MSHRTNCRGALQILQLQLQLQLAKILAGKTNLTLYFVSKVFRNKFYVEELFFVTVSFCVLPTCKTVKFFTSAILYNSI